MQCSLYLNLAASKTQRFTSQQIDTSCEPSIYTHSGLLKVNMHNFVNKFFMSSKCAQ